MKCSKCNSENTENAKFCQVCGNSLINNNNQQTTPSKKKKKGFLKPLLITVGIIFALFVIIGISSEDSNTQTSSTMTVEELGKFKNECKTIPYQELARTPDNYKGKKVLFTGEVLQVLEEGKDIQLRVNVTRTDYGYDDTIYVIYTKKDNETRILEDDIITIWGTANGLLSYKAVMGNEVTIPQVNAKSIEVTTN